jgi:hypothetical protein
MVAMHKAVVVLIVLVLAVVAAVRLERATSRIPGRILALVFSGGVILLAGLYLLAVTGRPPMPQRFGRLVWDYECGFTVDRVERKDTLGRGLRIAHARGTFYVVHARVVCPFGDRYRWNSSSAYVVSESSPWSATHYAIDAGAQAIVDARAGSAHEILGARELETLVFDLPKDLPQPALIFADTIGSGAFFGNLRVGRLYMPRRFNLRYD